MAQFAAVVAATGHKEAGTGARVRRAAFSLEQARADLFHYFIRLNIHDGRARPRVRAIGVTKP